MAATLRHGSKGFVGAASGRDPAARLEGFCRSGQWPRPRAETFSGDLA